MWRKRSFNSLFGVYAVVGYHTGKVLDVIKSSYCKSCEYWMKRQNTAEYEEWQEEHADKCLSNHVGSAEKMEVAAMLEIFQRSVERYGVKYLNYIGDGDSKTYSAIVATAPYGNPINIIKKECIGHVQKRMGNRLRACKNKNKGHRGRDKLTGKMIDKLSIYYGLAIRRNCDSKDKMKEAIWTTFYHYSSTDEKPQHKKCPEGSDSWCSWQRAKAGGTLKTYKPINTIINHYLRMSWKRFDQFITTSVRTLCWSVV